MMESTCALESQITELRQRIAELEAENSQLRCDTHEVAAARSFLRDQNRLLTQLAAHEAVIKQMREALEAMLEHSADLNPMQGFSDLDCEAVKNAGKALSLQPTTEHLDAYVKALLGEPVTTVENCYNADGLSRTIEHYLHANTPLYALKDKP